MAASTKHIRYLFFFISLSFLTTLTLILLRQFPKINLIQTTPISKSFAKNNSLLLSMDNDQSRTASKLRSLLKSGFQNSTGPFHSNVSLNKRWFWESIKPDITCPANLLERIGRGLNGKWTCGLANLGKLNRSNGDLPCIVYSFGIGDDASFDADVLKNPNCDVFAYDHTISKIKRSPARIHFRRLGIGWNNTESLRTLKTLMEENGHQWIDILKVDVEGAEYSSFEKIFADFKGLGLPFGQLLIEIHIGDWEDTNLKRLWPKKKEMLRLLETLEDEGMRIFHIELNPAYRDLYSEFSFVNINLFAVKRWLG